VEKREYFCRILAVGRRTVGQTGTSATVSYPRDIKLSDKYVIATWIIFFIVLLLECSENLCTLRWPSSDHLGLSIRFIQECE
jgi:hypothetical protein